MPTTYLLLRNNKQTGPLELEALLQLGLQPNDLIWIEGQSAGWQHPSEINSLKAYLFPQHDPLPLQPESDGRKLEPTRRDEPVIKASHIFVSLPANMEHRTAEPPADALEAKATALYQRVQAFAAGKTTDEDTDVVPARSLSNMKDEYGAWLLKQERRKKHGVVKRRLIMAGAVLILTTSVFGITKWMRTKPVSPETITTGYTQSSIQDVGAVPAASPSFEATMDSIMPHTAALPQLKKDPDPHRLKTITKPQAITGKKDSTTKAFAAPVDADTILKTAPASLPENKPVREPQKKALPLSRLITVTGTLQQKKNENNNASTQVSFANNSTEILKSVAVHITYFKNETRTVGTETVYFYNVAPGTAPVVNSVGNRRATSARFKIGAITRSDGSLYLID